MKSRYFDLPRPRLFGHRGRSADYPENTLPAFEAALAAGVPYLELDVWATRDGRIVVHHDETLLRTCGDPRRVSDLGWDELRPLDAGYGFTADGKIFPFRGQGIEVPLLEEVLREFPEALVNIEIKQDDPPVEEAVLAAVRRAGSEERVLLASEKDAVLRRMREISGEIPTSSSYGEVAAFIAWVQGGCAGSYRHPGAALQIPEEAGPVRLVTPRTIEAAHALGVEIHVWTVNEAADMRRLLEMGVDGLMSDRPDLLLKTSTEI